MPKQTTLNVRQAYQNRLDAISLVTEDGDTVNITGNAVYHLRVQPPFEEHDGRIRIREGWVKFVSRVNFHFSGGELDGQMTATTIVNGIQGDSEDHYVTTTTPKNNAINYFASTRGGEPMQRLRIPSSDGPHALDYVVDRRKISIEDYDRYRDDPPVVGIVIDVYCIAPKGE